MAKKLHSKFVFKELTPVDRFWEEILSPLDKYIFEAEIEVSPHTEVTAEGYQISPVSLGYILSYNTLVTFIKTYPKIIPLKEAKADFLKVLKVRKMHYKSSR